MYNLDQAVEHLQTTILNQLPSGVIPYLLQFLVWCKIAWAAFFQQVRISVSALLDSFRDPVILFHKVGDTYLLNPCNSRTRYNTVSSHQWEYNVRTKQFHTHTFSEHDNKRNLPYLGATLNYNLCDTPILIGDLSEWIADQKIVAPQIDLPLQVLVSSYLYTVHQMTVYDFTGYTLHVTNEMAEDVIYDVQSGEIIPPESEEVPVESNGSSKESETESESESESSVEAPPEKPSHLEELD